MSLLLIGLVLFFVPHSLSIVNENLRNRCAARLGELGWKGVYTIVSLLGLVLMIKGYGEARFSSAVLYTPPSALRHLSMLLMLFVFPLIVATYFPGRIKAFLKHPMLIATLLWGLAHLMLRGRAADVLLFGSFAVWALLDLLSMRSRKQRAIVTMPTSSWNDMVAIVIGLAIYGAFIFKVHFWVTGIPLIP